MAKLTKAWRRELQFLAERPGPFMLVGPRKAIGNKLVRSGLAQYHYGYPVGFSITPAGRSALEDGRHE